MKLEELFSGDFKRSMIIAEIAQSHDGSLGAAHAYIDAIADAGADAVKFQTHIAQYESTFEEPWRIKFSKQDETRYDYWRRMEFSPEQWQGLKTHAEEKGLIFMSSPFSREAASILDKMGIRIWKIASGEIGNYHMLDTILSTGKPVLLSSGLSDLQELDKTVERVRNSGNAYGVMQCTSNYPVLAESVGLNMISELRDRYACPSGLSDHSGSIFPSMAAMAMRAAFIEVHVTFDKRMFGPDVSSSITLEDLKTICDGSSYIYRMLTHPVDKNALPEDIVRNRMIFQKGLYASRDIASGEILGFEDLCPKKPFKGIPASNYEAVLGKVLKKDILYDNPIEYEDLED